MRAIETLMAEGHQGRFTPEGRIRVAPARSVHYSDSVTNALFMDEISPGELADELTDEERADFERWMAKESVADYGDDMARDRGIAG